MTERQRMHEMKEKGIGPPYTQDPILRMYRFCNVHREDDRVTRWLKNHWRDPNDTPKERVHLWHAMIVARFINWPPTLEWCGYPEPWGTLKRNFSAYLRRRKREGKVFTGAYIVSTNGAHMDKIDYVLSLFEIAWAMGSPVDGTLAGTHQNLMKVNGIGSFMAAQIVADLKHTSVLDEAPDWMTWAAPGPGSLRGLSRVRGFGTAFVWRKDTFLPELIKLRQELTAHTKIAETICLQDLQNCLCEYDKYVRVLKGQGRPRSTYKPSTYPV